MDIGKLFIFFGLALIIFGLLFSLGFRGLPGDIVIQRKNSLFIFPLATSLALSILITIVLLILRK